MNPEHRDFLNLARLPGSVTAEQVAILLGIADANISILVEKKFLHPLGHSVSHGLKKNAPKHFSSKAVMKLADDPDAMDRMHYILTTYYRIRNGTGVPPLKSVA